MVKVVEVAQTKRTTCYNCKSILEYGYSDITTTYERDYTGSGDKVHRIHCPICSALPTVEAFNRG